MANSLNVKVEKRSGGLWAELSGDITEDSEFSAVLNEKPVLLTLDLAGIKRINSTGVREWINFMSALKKDGARIVFERCSVAIVQQLNMIANFSGGAEILSIYAPYICPSCDNEESKLIDFRTTPQPNLEAEVKCTNCSEAMEFDDLPESYLAFRQQ
jgi:eukaryotic-like serine/threonine-protein kinase